MFGGSFDPPHHGHRRVIEEVLKLPEIERVIVVPTWLNPLKNGSFADPERRYRWCMESFGKIDGVIVSDCEISMGRAVYTIESASILSRRYDLGAIVIGSDNLQSMHRWREFEKLDERYRWIVASRPGSAGDLSILSDYTVIEPDIDISSTDIRRGGRYEMAIPEIAHEIERTYKKETN
jgi:nicotinate-nucleotide adenylyltransferase